MLFFIRNKNNCVNIYAMKKFNRNDTSFPAKLAEYVKSVRGDTTYPFLKYYQNIVRIVFATEMETRGLLVHHEMGLGKSILAVAAAIDMMPERQPIILLAKSLAENMRASIIKYVRMRAEYDKTWSLGRLSDEELDDWIGANFSFVSMNASNMLSQVSRAVSLDKKLDDILDHVSSLDGKLLIVDEAHNLFRAIVNGSKNGLGLYNLVQKSKNLKILFLTGTPIANDPFELVPCFNMLGSNNVLPEDYITFNRLYVDADGRLKNRGKFQNRLFGLISSVKSANLDGPKGEFPERLPLITVKVPMGNVQYTSYLLAREREREEGLRPGRGGNVRVALVKPKSRGSSTYRVKSRQISNFDMPPDTELDEIKDVTSPKFVSILENIRKHDGQKGLVYSQFVGNGGLAPFRKFLQSSGWTEITVGKDTVGKDTVGKDTVGKDTVGKDAVGKDAVGKDTVGKDAVGTYEPPSAALPSALSYITNIIEGAGTRDEGWWLSGDASPRVTENELDITAMMSVASDETSSEFVGASADITQFFDETIGGAEKKEYVVISGEVSIEDRTRVQKMYNTPGGCSLILVSSTGAEGLDLKRVRHIHIMEPYWNWGRIEQIISRGVRNDSHIDLPKEEKNVQAYIYLAVPPESEAAKATELTTDVDLYEDALKNRDSIVSFTEALEEVSIECSLSLHGKCRTCKPTDEPLYSADPEKDIRTRDPCSDYTEKELSVSEIVIDGVTYYYSTNEKSPYGITIFMLDADLNAYRQLKESHPIYQRIYSELSESESKSSAE
jgi:superfamily II DNA or RNA helicase